MTVRATVNQPAPATAADKSPMVFHSNVEPLLRIWTDQLSPEPSTTNAEKLTTIACHEQTKSDGDKEIHFWFGSDDTKYSHAFEHIAKVARWTASPARGRGVGSAVFVAVELRNNQASLIAIGAQHQACSKTLQLSQVLLARDQRSDQRAPWVSP